MYLKTSKHLPDGQAGREIAVSVRLQIDSACSEVRSVGLLESRGNLHQGCLSALLVAMTSVELMRFFCFCLVLLVKRSLTLVPFLVSLVRGEWVGLRLRMVHVRRIRVRSPTTVRYYASVRLPPLRIPLDLLLPQYLSPLWDLTWNGGGVFLSR